MQAFRFVVVYRGEQPARDDADPCWRGWIEQVFPESPDGQTRHFFQDPADVGAVISNAVSHVDD